MIKKKKQLTEFKSRIRSRHPSHDILRDKLPKMPVRSVVRMGSTTEVPGVTVEINSIEGVKNSANKLLMKQKFAEVNAKTAECWTTEDVQAFIGINTENKIISELPFPLVVKYIYGSRGTGNTLVKSQEQLVQLLQDKNKSQYIIEKYYSMVREYRIHCTKNECFYSCRKVLKNDTPEENRWFKNDSNSNWILEENELFDKPVNWVDIQNECMKTIVAVGLDIGAFDIRVQSAKKKDGLARNEVDYILVEVNSAPSFGEITAQKYLDILPKLILNKAGINQ